MKADRIAMASYTTTAFELFDFDQQTGVVSTSYFTKTLHLVILTECIFSPDDSLLYVGAASGGLYQYDLTASNIQASEYLVAAVNAWAIAEGPDEKLYVARPSSGYIGQINDPNVYGGGCNYVDTAVCILWAEIAFWVFQIT